MPPESVRLKELQQTIQRLKKSRTRMIEMYRKARSQYFFPQGKESNFSHKVISVDLLLFFTVAVVAVDESFLKVIISLLFLLFVSM